jgi:hypothetical protein
MKNRIVSWGFDSSIPGTAIQSDRPMEDGKATSGSVSAIIGQSATCASRLSPKVALNGAAYHPCRTSLVACHLL